VNKHNCYLLHTDWNFREAQYGRLWLQIRRDVREVETTLYCLSVFRSLTVAGIFNAGRTINGQPVLINGQSVVIQLWKDTCQKFLGLQNFPGGVGGEVGVYHRMPGRLRPTLQSLSFLPQAFAAFIVATIANLSDNQLWWAFPEINTQIQFTLTNCAYREFCPYQPAYLWHVNRRSR